MIGFVGDRQSRVVGDILSQRQFTVDVKSGHRLIGVVLCDECTRLGVELLVVLLSEPVVQVAVGIVLTSIVVEAMTYFVTDDGADSAVVDRVVGLHIEKGRL